MTYYTSAQVAEMLDKPRAYISHRARAYSLGKLGTLGDSKQRVLVLTDAEVETLAGRIGNRAAGSWASAIDTVQRKGRISLQITGSMNRAKHSLYKAASRRKVPITITTKGDVLIVRRRE